MIKCKFTKDGFENFQKMLKLSDAILELPILFKEDGIKVKGSDSRSAMLCEIKLDKDNFDKYDIEREEIIGIDNDKLQKTVKTFESPELKVEDGLLELKEGKKSFQFPLIDVNRDETELEKEFTYETTIDSDELQEDLKFSGKVSDYITLKANEDGLFLSSEKDNHKYRNKISGKGSYEDLVVNIDLDFLKPIVKNLKSFDLFLKDNFPVFIEKSLDNMDVSVIIAPMGGN